MQNSMTSNRTVMTAAIALFLLALVGLVLFYDPFHITTSNPETRDPQGFATTPVWLWFIGAFLLGGVIAYGISQNRKRRPGDIAKSDAGARRVYMREDQAASDGSSDLHQRRPNERMRTG